MAAQYGTMGTGLPTPSGLQKMVMMGSGGKKTAVNVAVKSPRLCCGLIAPPRGGWIGPFGMFKLVGMAFGGIAIYGVVAICYHVWIQHDGLQVALEVLLVLSALLCAVAAWSHEALMNNVQEISKQNQLYSRKLDKLEGNIQALRGVQDDLVGVAQKYVTQVAELNGLMFRMSKAFEEDRAADFLSAFVDQDGQKGNQVMDYALTGPEEVHAFLQQTQMVNVFKKIPNANFTETELYLAAAKTGGVPGISLEAVALAVNASFCSHRHWDTRATALAHLFLFSIAPHNQQFVDEAKEYSKKYLLKSEHFSTEASIDAEFTYCIAESRKTGVNRAVPGPALTKLMRTVAFINVVESKENDDSYDLTLLAAKGRTDL